MRIALDENLPLILREAFPSPHVVMTVQELGLSGIANGDLLDQLDGRFDTFVTADKNLKYQQNLAARSIAIIELPTNRLPVLTPMFARIAKAVTAAHPGEYIVLTSDG